MRRTTEEEPLLPPWVFAVALRVGPLAVLAAVWYLLNRMLHVPGRIVTPALAGLALAALVYFAGRLYKPFRVNKQGRCTARSARDRRGCRHFIPGARLGGGCGRLRENGRCRRVK